MKTKENKLADINQTNDLSELDQDFDKNIDNLESELHLEDNKSIPAPIKGKYKVLNQSGEYDTIYLETSAEQIIQDTNRRFVSDAEKTKWNNKAEAGGSLSQDFNARNLNISGSILPTSGNIDIGSEGHRFRSIYVDEAYLSTNTLYIGDTPILGTDDDTVVIKADPDQSITMQTSATGTTKIISESGVELSTSGMNANVVIQSKGTNSQTNIAAAGAVNINGPEINLTGATNVNGVLKLKNDLNITGNITVSGSNTAINTTNLTVKDNIVEINKGEAGVGVTGGKAGIKIDRGDSGDYNFLFDEADDLFKIGPTSDLKPVATREWVQATVPSVKHNHKSADISDATERNYINTLVKRDAYGNFQAGTISATLSGNATSATKLQTARTINGVAFDGTKNIVLKADPNPHSHDYRPNSWVPSWNDVTGKPAFNKVATSGSYNDLSNKPTIHTILDSSTSSTINTWSTKKINDELNKKANASHTHTHSQITGLGSAATLNAGTSANNVLKLDSSGKIPESVLPKIAINETFTSTDETTALSLTVQVGDIVVLTAPKKGITTTYICVDSSKSVFEQKFKPLNSSADTASKGELQQLLSNKVDKEPGKGLSTNDFSAAYKQKLDGIAANANNYVHPSSHAATMINQDSTHRFVTDAEKNTWNSKANSNHDHNNIYPTKAKAEFTDTISIITPANN